MAKVDAMLFVEEATATPEAEGEKEQEQEVEEKVEAEGGEGEAEEATAEETAAEGQEASPEKEELPEGKPEEKAAPELDGRLLHAGRRAGLDDTQMEALGANAAGVLSKLADGFDAVSADMAKVGSPRLFAAAAVKKEVAAPEAAKPTGAAMDFSKPFALNLDEDVLGPELVGVLKPVEQYVNSLQEKIARLEGAEGRRQAESLMETADAFFGEVNEEYGGLFGKGKTLALKVDSDERKMRLKVGQMADIIYAGADARGISMTPKEALERGLSLLTREEQMAAVRKSFTAKAKTRSGQRIQRPTHRATEAKYDTPQAKAAAIYRAARKEKGAPVSEEEE